MLKKRLILRFIVVILIIIFAIYEDVIIALKLINFDVNSGESRITLIIGIVLFSLIILVGLGLLVYMLIKQRQKKYYILKK